MTGPVTATENDGGPPPRHIDSVTETLAMYAKAFEDAQQIRKASQLRGDELAADAFKTIEAKLSRRLKKELKNHILWPWLEDKKGLAGPLTARVISLIGDPLRFPGQKCTIGHTLPPFYGVGEACPITADEISTATDGVAVGGEDFDPGEKALESEVWHAGVEVSHTAADWRFEPEVHDVRCVGTMLPPRPHTGVSSLWHYFGLHVVDGKLPKRRKGVQADWNPTGRNLALQPDGIADQIIKHRTPKYRDIYDAAKERGKFHKVARTIAAKAFLGDLLTEWKRLVEGAGHPIATGTADGPLNAEEAA